MIISLAKNKTQYTNTKTGVIILVSYSTPVAMYVPNQGYFKTRTKWSKTTTRHINDWIGSNPFTIIDQEQLQVNYF